MIDFTTVVGIDRVHLEELRAVWPTWRAFRPEMLAHPLLAVCDGDVDLRQWGRELAFVDHPRLRLCAWSMSGVSQRKKMLTGLVRVPARLVDTPWYLKLDTDVVALAPGDWLQEGWFAADEQGRPPVFISSPWGYTKPPDAIERLDAWGDTVSLLRDYPRLDLSPRPGAGLVRHPRIISWCSFGDTAWTRRVAAACGERLPVPSQDTLLWYCAARRGEFFRRVRMSRFGWRHLQGRRRLAQAASQALAAAGAGFPTAFIPEDAS